MISIGERRRKRGLFFVVVAATGRSADVEGATLGSGPVAVEGLLATTVSAVGLVDAGSVFDRQGNPHFGFKLMWRRGGVEATSVLVPLESTGAFL